MPLLSSARESLLEHRPIRDPQEPRGTIPAEASMIPINSNIMRRCAIICEEEESDTRVEHEFFLRERSSSPLFSLRCRSRAISSSHKPVFFDGDKIEGGVQLMVQKTAHVEEVTLRIQGRIAPPETGRPDIFWSTTQSLWKSSRDNPQKSLYKTLAGSSARLAAGNYSWPLAFQLPLEVKVDTNSGVKVYPLPPSYRKAGPSAVLEYEMLVTADRGLLLEPHTLSVPFVYVPRSSPEYPFGRFQYCSEETPARFIGIPSRTLVLDYSGSGGDYWSIPTMTIEGTIFGNRMAQVICHATFKRPLIYPRGRKICVSILLESADCQALDLVASNMSFRLEQKAVVAGDQVWDDTLATGSFINLEDIQSSTSRKLKACLDCPRDVKPTFSFITFTLQHFLTLRFHPPGPSFFLPSSKSDSRLTQSIQIVTDRSLHS